LLPKKLQKNKQKLRKSDWVEFSLEGSDKKKNGGITRPSL
jgi:hypothetical protein